MATTEKLNVTRANAMRNVLAVLDEYEITWEDDTRAALERILASFTRPSVPKGETPARKQNRKILADNLEIVAAAGEQGITAPEFAQTCPNFPTNNEGKPSINKGTAVLVQGVNEGILRKITPEKRSQPLRYVLA